MHLGVKLLLFNSNFVTFSVVYKERSSTPSVYYRLHLLKAHEMGNVHFTSGSGDFFFIEVTMGLGITLKDC